MNEDDDSSYDSDNNKATAITIIIIVSTVTTLLTTTKMTRGKTEITMTTTKLFDTEGDFGISLNFCNH